MQKILDMRWRIALMLCAITTINYLDRQALSVAAPVLMDEFSISNTQYGWIGSAFLFAYALGQLLTGPLIDRLGTKKGFNLAVVVCVGCVQSAAIRSGAVVETNNAITRIDTSWLCCDISFPSKALSLRYVQTASGLDYIPLCEVFLRVASRSNQGAPLGSSQESPRLRKVPRFGASPSSKRPS